MATHKITLITPLATYVRTISDDQLAEEHMSYQGLRENLQLLIKGASGGGAAGELTYFEFQLGVEGSNSMVMMTKQMLQQSLLVFETLGGA